MRVRPARRRGKDALAPVSGSRPRCRFALCRAALRVILAERLGCSNRRLSFSYGEHGKPFALVAHRRESVGFNASHSDQHVLIAIAAHYYGTDVDVEERAPRRDLDGIGSMVYGPAERRLLALAAGSRKLHLFYRLWSMKEALIKALGSRFSLNPSSFEVPEPMLHGVRSNVFRFPHTSSSNWCLIDLSEDRFAAATSSNNTGPPPWPSGVNLQPERPLSCPLNLTRFGCKTLITDLYQGVITRKRFSESEIIKLLQAIEVKISGGMGTEEACRSLGVSDKSYYRWRKLYGSMGLKIVQDLRKTSDYADRGGP